MKQLTSIDDLHPDPQNPRKISAESASGLGYSLEEFGDLSGIVWNSRTGQLVCGHQRLTQLKSLGAVLHGQALRVGTDGSKIFGIRIVDWPVSKQRAANVAANNQYIQGEFVLEPLGDLLAEINASLGDKLFSDLRLDKLLPDFLPKKDEKEDDVPDAPKNPIVATGDRWLLGDHVLVCGAIEDMGHVLFDKDWDLLVTDPPYGVSYAGKNEFLNSISPGNRIQKEIENDHRTPDEMFELWKKWFAVVRQYGKPGAAYYVTGPQGGDLLLLLLALRESEFTLRHMLIWSKNNHVLGRCDYHYKHEPIIYGWLEGAGHHAVENRSETSVWEIDKPHKSDLHPTMKPVALYERAMVNSSNKSAVVADTFAGSGTVFIAAEKTGRRAYGAEFDPAYCDVIIQRWEEFTGGKAVKG